jgi:hypothetical protein
VKTAHFRFRNQSRSRFADEALLTAVWMLFGALFPTQEACLKELLRRNAGDNIFRCRYCLSEDTFEELGGRSIKCKGCKRRTWLTASTFFENIRHPRAWLAAIFLRERGVTISAARFQRLVGDIAYSTAWDIFKKLEFVITQQMENSFLTTPTAHFRDVICKRSLMTPPREHPFAEEAECGIRNGDGADKFSQHDEYSKSSSTSMYGGGAELSLPVLAGTSSLECEIYEALSTEPLHFDALLVRTKTSVDQLLSAITMLELQGLVTNIGGNRYVRSEPRKGDPRVVSLPTISASGGSVISLCIEFVKRKFQGVSRKYLQFYLAEYWCYIDRTRWSLGGLLRTCQQFCYVRTKEIRSYESPLMVRISPSVNGQN